MPKCPVCGEELLEVGYPKDFLQEYRCPNGCRFEAPLSWKIQNAFGVFIIILAIIALAIILTAMIPLKMITKKRCLV
ncbi:MAG TPA: hypothetical protein ENG66_06500 [Thermococcus sp.]|nr:MAG: hypothetical protein DRP04_03470 [Archaeoglobales archaeon]HDH45020.1 hypothetical protein [Thermococcus sp.]